MISCLCEIFTILLINRHTHDSVKKSLLFRLKQDCHQIPLHYFKEGFHKSCSEGLAITSQKQNT